jgi:hypothetical protein
MTHAEWLCCTDVPAMLEVLWEAHSGDEATLVPHLHRYLVACCRRIQRLLPQEDSRRGIEVAERYLSGLVTDAELGDLSWYVEAAAFNIDYNGDPESIQQWVDEVGTISAEELTAMLNPPGVALDIDARELLKRAAYFAEYAIFYPHRTRKRGVPDHYVPFLSAELLQEQFQNPFKGQEGGCA